MLEQLPWPVTIATGSSSPSAMSSISVGLGCTNRERRLQSRSVFQAWGDCCRSVNCTVEYTNYVCTVNLSHTFSIHLHQPSLICSTSPRRWNRSPLHISQIHAPNIILGTRELPNTRTKPHPECFLRIFVKALFLALARIDCCSKQDVTHFLRASIFNECLMGSEREMKYWEGEEASLLVTIQNSSKMQANNGFGE